jgi:hypothetical protein
MPQLVAYFRAAGAIIIVKTNVPQVECNHPLFWFRLTSGADDVGVRM